MFHISLARQPTGLKPLAVEADKRGQVAEAVVADAEAVVAEDGVARQ